LSEQVSAAVHAALEERETMRESEAEAEPTETNWTAYREAETIVNNALIAKVWTDADRKQLHVRLRNLTREQRRDLMRSLVPAVNSGQLDLETGRIL
jgi:hypothetical protein